MYLRAMNPNDAIFNISMLKMNDRYIASAHISIQGVPIYSVIFCSRYTCPYMLEFYLSEYMYI